MAGNVTLSAAVRSNLLSLQGTTELINRTQGRLSTGLKVASAVDDPVSYFQAKGLNDRASDFTAKKDSIDQGISTLTAATNAVDGIESLVKQLKGLVLSAKSATTSSQISTVVTQFTDLRNQINNLANDSTYQGLNLVAGTGQTLRVDFSNLTASTLSVQSEDLTVGNNGLSVTTIENASASTAALFNTRAVSAGTTFSSASTIVVTMAQSSDITLTTANDGNKINFSLGSHTVTVSVGTAGTITVSSATPTNVLSAGEVFTFTLAADSASTGANHASFSAITTTGVSLVQTAEIAKKTYIGVGFSDTLNNMITDLETNLTTVRSVAQKLGSNVSLLQTRLDFTKNYVNTLTAGAGKLNLADLNEEGANLLALQTRQQLGVQALSFAGQAEQGILSLFR